MSNVSRNAALKAVLGTDAFDARRRPVSVLEKLATKYPGQVATAVQDLANRVEALGGDLSAVQVSALRLETENAALRAVILDTVLEQGVSVDSAQLMSLATRLGAELTRSLNNPLLTAAVQKPQSEGDAEGDQFKAIWAAALSVGSSAETEAPADTKAKKPQPRAPKRYGLGSKERIEVMQTEKTETACKCNDAGACNCKAPTDSEIQTAIDAEAAIDRINRGESIPVEEARKIDFSTLIQKRGDE